MRRRQFLRAAGTVAAAMGLAGCPQPDTDSEPTPPPMSGTPTPHGGTESDPQPDFVVATKADLLDALDSASSGNLIYLEGDADVDLTDTNNLTVPGGVTLASNRGADGSPGGRLRTNSVSRPLLQTGGDGVRLIGLRLRGQQPDGYFDPNSQNVYGHDSEGFRSLHAGTEVRNCEVSHFTYSGIVTRGSNELVRRCHIHNNCMRGLGYGITVLSQTAKIRYNFFNYNRHSVACAGARNQSYVCENNIQGPDTVSHSFDVHSPGGGEFHFRNNQILATRTIHGTPTEGIFVRGRPQRRSTVSNNAFAHPTPPSDRPTNDGAIFQTETGGQWRNLDFWSNRFAITEMLPWSDWDCIPRGCQGTANEGSQNGSNAQ